jgi:glutamine synthetase
MNDEKLLELAAKAIGEPYYEHVPGGGLYLSNGVYWNPLTNDGDALRLAVKLEVQVVIPGDNKDVYAGKLLFDAFEPVNGDPYAATRRAIVRAAADMAKAEGWVQS